MQEVFSFNILQIGEHAKNLSQELTEKYNQIPWSNIVGMRNKIVHGYDTIDKDFVWEAATVDFINLKNYCNKILEEN